MGDLIGFIIGLTSGMLLGVFLLTGPNVVKRIRTKWGQVSGCATGCRHDEHEQIDKL